VPAVQSIPNGSQGATPACKNTAPKGQRPPANAQEKEQPNHDNIGAAGSYVNGKADAFPYSEEDGGIVWHKNADTKIRIAEALERFADKSNIVEGVLKRTDFVYVALIADEERKSGLCQGRLRNEPAEHKATNSDQSRKTRAAHLNSPVA
jgi:hypothetical protein